MLFAQLPFTSNDQSGKLLQFLLETQGADGNTEQQKSPLVRERAPKDCGACWLVLGSEWDCGGIVTNSP